MTLESCDVGILADLSMYETTITVPPLEFTYINLILCDSCNRRNTLRVCVAFRVLTGCSLRQQHHLLVNTGSVNL